jgi:FKBP-type peptidyl-prolyl cis-trans isomerase FkpA
MYKKLFFIIALPFLIAACNKSSSPDCSGPKDVASAAETAKLKTYLGADSLTYTQHPSGFFYKITTAGTGTASPTVCSAVLVKYSGRFTTSATPFDQNTTGVAFNLGNLIKAWQIGIPLLKKGGSIILYVPPSLGYGSGGNPPRIPGDAYLVFTVDLVDFQ